MIAKIKISRYYLSVTTINKWYLPSSIIEVDERDAVHRRLVRQRRGHYRNAFDMCTTR